MAHAWLDTAKTDQSTNRAVLHQALGVHATLDVSEALELSSLASPPAY